MSKTNQQVAYAALPAVDEDREMTDADFKRGGGEFQTLKKLGGVCAALVLLLFVSSCAHCGNGQQSVDSSRQGIPGLRGIRDSFALPGPHRREPPNHHQHVLDGPHRNGPLPSKRQFHHDGNIHSLKNPHLVLDGPLHHDNRSSTNSKNNNYMMAKDEFRHDMLPTVLEFQGHSKNGLVGKHLNEKVEHDIILHPAAFAGPHPNKQHALPEDNFGSLYHKHHFPGATGPFPHKANHPHPPKQQALPDIFDPPHHQRHFPNDEWAFHHPVKEINNNNNNNNNQEVQDHDDPIDHDTTMEAEIETAFLEVEGEQEQDEREAHEEEP